MNNSDKYVMYLIRRDLPLSLNKWCAQVSHGAQKITEDFFCGKKSAEEKEAYKQWTEDCYTKIVLLCPEDKWEILKNLPLRKIGIKDAGFTEIPPGTETVLAFWPLIKKNAPKEIQELKAK
jgi:peptidyl-tRNA hydrolase